MMKTICMNRNCWFIIISAKLRNMTAVNYLYGVCK